MALRDHSAPGPLLIVAMLVVMAATVFVMVNHG